MGLFRRRSKEPMDSALEFMTVTDADHLRTLFVGALADLGIGAQATGGEVRCDDGTVLGLWNVATVCGALERDAWPEAVTEHVAGLVVVAATPTVEEMTTDDVLAMVKFRLSEQSYVRHMPEPPADVVEFAPGVVRHLVLDTPESVQTVPAATLLGKAPVEALREAAERNTRTILDEPWEAERLGEGANAVHVVVGESFFTATLALYVDEVVCRVVPDADLSRGIVFAMPMRHQVAFHVPTDAAAVREIVPVLLRFAGHGFEEGAGPVSPELYYWETGEVTALTAPDETGRVRVTPTGALRALVGGLQD